MSGVGRLCLYCRNPIEGTDRAALCESCMAAHHEGCWDRNGRCSTFRCAGVPRTMLGVDIAVTMEAERRRANAQPEVCPFCANRVYAGVLQGKGVDPKLNVRGGTGLMFRGRSVTRARKGVFGWRGLGKALSTRTWFLPGAHIEARSCGRCRRLFLWGAPVDARNPKPADDEEVERFCLHCGKPMWIGEIVVKEGADGAARFECADTPEFHAGWIGGALLDKFVFNKWRPAASIIPAYSCESCQYTEVSGRPVYRAI